jgi:hypothetical protein
LFPGDGIGAIFLGIFSYLTTTVRAGRAGVQLKGSLFISFKFHIMTTSKQTSAAKENIKKAQKKWKSMTPRQHALAQPQGRMRKRPGATGKGEFYRIEVRPKGQFSSFRTQDVGKKGGLERIAGHRASGSWDTVTWLVSKKEAHVEGKHLVIDSPKAKTVLNDLSSKVVHVKGDIFTAKPRKNIPEKSKPTIKQKAAQSNNIKKAQAARKKK